MDSYLVKAELKDIRLLYQWVNDEVVRENSFNTEQISEEQHKKWFVERLNSNTTDIYIYYYKGIAIGQLRLDYEGTTAIIDYSIDRAYRGQGHGTMLLSLIEKIDNKKKPIKCYIGRVKFDNISSQYVFTKMRYDKSYQNNYIEFIKELSDV